MSRRIQVGTGEGLMPGQHKLAFVDGRSIALFNIDGTLHAFYNSCPHHGISLL